MTDFERGQWHALNRVLALIQTYEKNVVKRSQFYRDVFELRPQPDPTDDQDVWE